MNHSFKKNGRNILGNSTDSSMQQVYSSKQPKRKEHKKEVVGQEQEQNEKVVSTQEVSGFGLKRLKPFKEMSTEEKLEYLGTYVGRRAPFPCTFQTENAIHKGVLTKLERQTIEVKTFEDKDVTIRKKDIKVIGIIGDM